MTERKHTELARVEVVKGDGTINVVGVPRAWNRGDRITAKRLQEAHRAVGSIARGAIDHPRQNEVAGPQLEAHECTIVGVRPDYVECVLGVRGETQGPSPIVKVLKPYNLRHSTWQGTRKGNLSFTRHLLYENDVTAQGRRVAISAGVEGTNGTIIFYEYQEVTPRYDLGQRLLCVKRAMGGSSQDLPSYFDLNVDARVWGTVSILENSDVYVRVTQEEES